MDADSPIDLLNQTALRAYLPVDRYPWIIRIHEHAFTSVINFKASFTGWAGDWSGLVSNISLSTEGANHWSIPINQIGQLSPIVFKVLLAMLKLAIPPIAFFRCEK